MKKMKLVVLAMAFLVAAACAHGPDGTENG